MRRSWRIGWVLVAILAATLGSAPAQPYPTRPVTVVVAWPPGSGMDVMTRIMQDALREELGQPIVVDNRPGAAGSIGAQAVARAAPDGYTLLFTAASLNMVAVMGARLPFEVPGSFTPVVNVAVPPSLLVVHRPRAWTPSRSSSPRRARGPGSSSTGPPASARRRTS